MNGVVVGVDGSSGSARALRFALDEARMRGVTLHVVSAWAVPALAYSGGTGVAGLPAALEAGAGEAIEHVLGPLEQGQEVAIERHVVEGPAAPVLLDAGVGADLLVVGSRGLGGVGRLLLGSVGREIVHAAPCPVAIVPAAGD
jgi:nucleotide-binding universal stress UspA family protein